MTLTRALGRLDQTLRLALAVALQVCHGRHEQHDDRARHHHGDEEGVPSVALHNHGQRHARIGRACAPEQDVCCTPTVANPFDISCKDTTIIESESDYSRNSFCFTHLCFTPLPARKFSVTQGCSISQERESEPKGER